MSTLARTSQPIHHTLYSKSLRVDILVGERRATSHSESVYEPSGRRAGEQRIYVTYFPLRVRISWSDDPDRVISLKTDEARIESSMPAHRLGRDRVEEIAGGALDDLLMRDPPKYKNLIKIDRDSRSAIVSWEPSSRHVLAAESGPAARALGMGAPPAVKLRIWMLLRQTSAPNAFEAESARMRAADLLQQYGLAASDIEAEFGGSRRGGSARKLLGRDVPSSRRRRGKARQRR